MSETTACIDVEQLKKVIPVAGLVRRRYCIDCRTEIKIDGEDLVVMREDDIMGVLDK